MRWKVLRLGVGLLALLAAAFAGVFVYGLTLPREMGFTRSMQLKQPAEVVFAVVTDYAAQRNWRTDLKTYEKLPDRDGRPAWRVTDTHNVVMLMVQKEAIEPRRVVEHYSGESSAASVNVTREYSIGAIPGGTLISLRERAVIPNPFFRGMTRLLFGSKFADDYLAALARKFGEEPVIAGSK